MRDRFGKHLATLTRTGKASESSIERALANLLEEHGEVITQHQTGDGPCDIFLPSRRVVVETKERSKAGDIPKCGPERPGSAEGETQFEQVRRYVLALRRKEQRTLWEALASPDTPWIGALTDGNRWWAWEWTATGDDEVGSEMQLLHGQNYHASPEALHRVLSQLANREAGKPWVPAAPADLFRSAREELGSLWVSASSTKSGQTQHDLWHDLVRGSGIEVSDARRHPLFLDHCFLVTLARFVSRALDRQPYEALADSFIAWIPHTPGGEQWARDLFERVDAYDWGSREVDVLRTVYQEIVPKADRKLYGEYYTPDWLAHLIVEETLDEEWLECAIKAAYKEGKPPAGVGVLDPTCGSGTFLFHAARRILDAIPRVLPNANPRHQAEITAQLVNGIDIHPVAVEMSRATLRRALPAAVNVGVYQGDALLVADTQLGQQAKMFNSKASEFRCHDSVHQNHIFYVPHEFTDLPDFEDRLARLVQAARDKVDLPRSITSGLKGDNIEWIKIAHETLVDIIAEHGDGIWEWYIRNQLMPRALARRKVDRIVSNPPWLRWNEIQTQPRKRLIKERAEPHDLLSPKQGGRTSFDMAGVFVVDTREKYLARPVSDPSTYVLNSAALSAENWRRFRELGHASGGLDLRSKHVDGHVLLARPFHGAEACVIGLRHSEVERLVLSERSAPIDPEADVSPKALVRRVPQLPLPQWSPSPYASRPRQGATIGPAILVRIDPNNPEWTYQPKRATEPWSDFSPTRLEDIPEEWRLPYLRSGDITPFRAGKPSIAIIPNDEGRLLSDREAAECSNTWRGLTNRYQAHAGKGETTPKDLAGLLDFRGQLTKQLPLRHSVMYNKSGQNLRAVFTTGIVNDTLYRISVDSVDEGDYLTAWLNSSALRLAFRLARNTDRDFHKTPLEKVPVPRFRPQDKDHQAIAAASGAIRNCLALGSDVSYPHAVRNELTAIETISRRLLPEFCISVEDFP